MSPVMLRVTAYNRDRLADLFSGCHYGNGMPFTMHPRTSALIITDTGLVAVLLGSTAVARSYATEVSETLFLRAQENWEHAYNMGYKAASSK